jgi:hypothetical protein
MSQQQLELTPEEKLDLEERVTERVDIILRHRRFVDWLNLGMREIALGRNANYIREHHKPPHQLDDYEIKRAIEAGLY